MRNSDVFRRGMLGGVVAIMATALTTRATNVNVNWDNGAADNAFSNAVNWASDMLPNTGFGGVGDFVRIDLSGASRAVYSATLDNPGVGATSAQAGIFSRLQIADVSGNGQLDITGGIFKTDSTTMSVIGSSGRTGTLNISGASTVVELGGYVIAGNGTGGTGVVNVISGSFASTRDATVGGIPRVSIVLGNGSNARGTMVLSGGQISTRSGIVLGGPGTTGRGRFEIRGNNTVNVGTINTADDGYWLQHANSTLAAYVTNGQLGTILVDNLNGAAGTYSDGNVIFMPGALLEVGFLGAPINGSWDVMRWRGTLLTNGLAFASSVTDTNWSFAMVDTDIVPGVDTLRVTYTLPGAPGGLSATAGVQQVALSWNTVSNATSYNVKRALTNGGPYTTIGNTTNTSFLNAGLTNGVTYYYVVSSIIGGGESANSTEVSTIPTRFVHPGGLFKQSDMERMRFMVQTGVEPWRTSFNTLKVDPKASYLYTVQGDPNWTDVSRDPPSTHKGQYESDVTAAYLNALMWIVTQDTRHADKCVEIFNTWKNLTNVQGGGTESLNGGLYAWKFVEAAEIIKSTYSGWAAADIQAFKDMLVYPGYSDTAVPASVNTTNGTFYWRIYKGDPGRHGNQDLIAWRAMIVMGVFLDNEKMYDRALRYFKGLPGRTDDIAMPTGPSPSGNVNTSNQYFIAYNYLGSQGLISNYGYNGVLTNYVWENGQNQESSRDQQHAFFGLGICAGISEVAWNQGDDVWNTASNRLQLGFEFMSRYNTSYIQSFPDQPSPWEPTNFIQRTERTGRWRSLSINPHFESDFVSVSRGEFAGGRPVYEQAAAHFVTRMGLESNAVWTLRGRDVAIALSGYETTGSPTLDHPGWGALTFRRPINAAGDPISGFALGLPVFAISRLPGTIAAANYDYFPTDGEGRTYHDLTPTNSGGAYRNDAVDVATDLTGAPFVTDFAAGEWLTYTVNIPANGSYGIAVEYAAANAGSTLRATMGSNDITADVPLQATGGLNSWRSSTLASQFNLTAGVQVLRLAAGGTSPGFNLKSISLRPALSYVAIGNALGITWPTNLPGWRLEAQTNTLAVGLGSNWAAVSGSTTTNQMVFPISPSNGAVYFRLVNP